MKHLNKMVAILLAFLSFLPVQGQEIMVVNKDTIVAITPKDVKTINTIIVGYEWRGKEIQALDSLVKKDSLLLATKDSLLATQLVREKKKEDYYIEQAKALATENATLKKKKKVGVRTAGGIGLLVGLLIGLIL